MKLNFGTKRRSFGERVLNPPVRRRRAGRDPRKSVVAKPFMWGANTVSRTVKSTWGERTVPIRKL